MKPSSAQEWLLIIGGTCLLISLYFPPITSVVPVLHTNTRIERFDGFHFIGRVVPHASDYLVASRTETESSPYVIPEFERDSAMQILADHIAKKKQTEQEAARAELRRRAIEELKRRGVVLTTQDTTPGVPIKKAVQDTVYHAPIKTKDTVGYSISYGYLAFEWAAIILCIAAAFVIAGHHNELGRPPETLGG